jgi:hypothetical protein
MEESPILVHIWSVDPAEQGVAAQALGTMFGEIAADPGFASAKVLESADGSSIAALVEMKTVEDRKRMEQLPAVRETLDHLPGTINIVLRMYHEVVSYQSS